MSRLDPDFTQGCSPCDQCCSCIHRISRNVDYDYSARCCERMYGDFQMYTLIAFLFREKSDQKRILTGLEPRVQLMLETDSAVANNCRIIIELQSAIIELSSALADSSVVILASSDREALGSSWCRALLQHVIMTCSKRTPALSKFWKLKFMWTYRPNRSARDFSAE